ncbi:Ulp1 family isopeptidase [Chlamydia suis]|uniref:Ulp1 family isopeptidase n=1 Tax=Chlamydia suis TaxID=83559 RepID=UPI0009AFA22C|nr:Ulp1 family isopeptidase [Chlamydia suis]QYC86766.1 deubiquitinase [Chlamydia suis]QYC87670.1 deubiquitinase [Chlamydia suis]QYC90359.1 deubiquitinase [Chlamydia suis]
MLSSTSQTTKTLSPEDSSRSPLIPPKTRQCSVHKVARVALAVFLVVITLGLILCFYSFSRLVSFPWCCQRCYPVEKTTITIPLTPPSPPIAIKRPGIPKAPKIQTTKEKLGTPIPEMVSLDPFRDAMLRKTIETLVPAWDNETIFKCLCYFHTLHKELIPLDLFPPATIFNFKRKISSLLEDKKNVKKNKPLKGRLPISCLEDNYRRHLKNAKILPIFIWYHPTPKTHHATLQCMQQMGISRAVGASHWVLIVVDLRIRKLVYFDSLYDYVKSPTAMEAELTAFADELNMIYPSKKNKKFSVHIAAKEVLQKCSGLSCGPWCCQFLKWYLEDPLVNPSDRVSEDILASAENLASFAQACEEASQTFSDLSWPQAKEE